MKNGTITTAIDSSNRSRTVYLASRSWFQDSASPLITMLKGKGYVDNNIADGSIASGNQKVEWVAKEVPSTFVYVAAAIATATTLTLTSGSTDMLQVNDILLNTATGEQMRITGKPAGMSITVNRGVGAQSAVAIVAGPLAILSTAYGEGTRGAEGTVVLRVHDYNYSQIFKDAIQITRNEAKSKRYGDDGDKRLQRRQEVWELHKRKIEKQLLFGQRSKTVDSTGNDLYIAGGVNSYIVSNRFSITGGFTIAKFNNALAAVADKEASGDKYLFCGSKILNAINDEGLSAVGGGAGNVVKEYGVAVSKIITSYGEISVAFHPVISNLYPNMGMLLDLKNIRYTPIDDTRLEKDIQENDYDGFKDQFITDTTIQILNEERHAVITLD